MNIIFVLLFGLSINGYNADKAGHPVESVGDFKAAVHYSVTHSQPVYKFNE